jgi:transcriptional regulator with XRE-family HTH domain
VNDSPAVNGTPAIRRRLVGAALRRYRVNSGFTLGDAAQVLESDRSKLSRIETGQRGIRARDLRDLLTEYGVGEHERAFLIALANPKTAAGWWRSYTGALDESQRDMVLMEALATQVHCYRTQRIPGLLQTEQYAAAMAAASTLTAQDQRRVVEATLARQDAVLGAKEPALSVIITEAALCQQAGRDGVMRAQITRLAGLAGGSQRLTLQVIPFGAGAHPAPDLGALTIMTFGQAPQLGIVHLAGIGGGLYLEHHDDVATYATAFTQLSQAALSPADSAALLERWHTCERLGGC